MKNSKIRSYRKFVKPSDEFDSNKKIYFRNGAKQVAKGNAVLADPLNPYVPGELIVNFDSQPAFSKFNSKFKFMYVYKYELNVLILHTYLKLFFSLF